MKQHETRSTHVRWFEQIGVEDVPLMGGKNASLGEMYRELAPQGIRVPNGFAVTADAYRYFLRASRLDQKLRELLRGLDTKDLENLRSRGHEARQAILAAELPADLEEAIASAYQRLSAEGTGPVDVAVLALEAAATGA